MPKKSQQQKPEVTSAVSSPKSAHAAKTGKDPASRDGRKKTAPQSKCDRVLSLLKQARGASLEELMKATKWQAHSVRGFLSGAVRKKMGLTVQSARDEAGTRRYRIADGQAA